MSNNPYAPGLNIPDEMRENPVLTKLFVQLMSLVCMIIFADISWEAIRIATNKQTDLSMFLPIALGLLFVMMFVFFYIAKKMKPQS
jgi:TRAP-type C4-dicarboxylate transport system permease small subunit